MKRVSKLSNAEEISLEASRQEVLYLRWKRHREMIFAAAMVAPITAGLIAKLLPLLPWVLRVL